MTDYQSHVWYDFSQDRHRPIVPRDEAALAERELRLAEMQDRDQARGRVLPLRRVTR